MKQQKPIRRLLIICIISGLIAGIITDFLFWCFPSAWLFFIIPAIMGWSIDHFGKIPREHLHDEETFEKLKIRTGLLCAFMSLFFIILALLPIFIILSASELLLNFIFFGVCILSIYWCYTRGQRCIVDAYYDTL